MFKSFLEGVAKKAGEAFASWVGPMSFAAVGAMGVWLSVPEKLLVLRATMLLVGLAAALAFPLVYVAGFHVAKNRYGPHGPPVGSLERDLLRLLWTQAHNTVIYKTMLKLAHEHPSRVRLAGERLQQRGYIAFSYTDGDSLLQLLPEGREYVVTEGLDKEAELTLLRRIHRLDD